MSYFTDESEYKSSGGVIDPLDIAGPRPTGGQEAGAYFDKLLNTDLLISESVNERRALEERMKIISEHSGIDTMEALKPHGYEEGFFSGKGDPWLSSGRSDDFEKAVEAYANSNPDVKGKLFYGEGIRERAKEIAQAEDKRTSKITERGKNGWWPALVGSAGAYAVDPLFVFTQMVAPEIAFARLAAKGVQMGFGARVVARTGIDATAGFIYELPAQKLAVQPYKQSLGIEHSNSDVAMNVFLGTVLGGAFGGAFEGLAGGFRKLKTGEWTPKELNEWAAKERPNMPPEEQQALDMAMQAVEHERLNPYGPEGRDKFNQEMATFNERANTNERMPSEMELEKAATDMQKVLTPEEAEFQELRAYSREQAGIIDDIPEQAVKQPDANPLGEYEAQLRSITDGLEVGDDVALNTLTSSGIDEATARQAIDYAINNGILTKDADGKLTFARKVDDQNPVLKTDSEDTPKLNAETEKGQEQHKQSLQAMSDKFKIGDEFSSGFLRRMGFDRAQIDDFIDHGMETGYLSEKNGKLKISRRSEGPPKEKNKTIYEIAQQERLDAAMSFARAKKAYGKAIEGNDTLKIKEARKQLMIATNARNKAREKAVELDSEGVGKTIPQDKAVATKINDGITKADTEAGQAHITQYGPVGSREWGVNRAAEIRKARRNQIDAKANASVDAAELDKLFADAARILPDGIGLKLADSVAGGKANASFSPNLQLLQIANDVVNKGQSLRHEAVHILRNHFTKDEWSSLVDAARKSDLLDDAKYRDVYAGRENFDDLIDQEHVAKLIEYAHNGGDITKLSKPAQNIIKRIIESLKSLAKTLLNPEFKNVAKIIDDLERGEIAKRSPGNKAKGSSDELFNLRDDYDHEVGIDGDEYLSLLTRHPMKAMLFHSIDGGVTWHDPAGLVKLRNALSEDLDGVADGFLADMVVNKVADARGTDEFSDVVRKYMTDDQPGSAEEVLVGLEDYIDQAYADWDQVTELAKRSGGLDEFNRLHPEYSGAGDVYSQIGKIDRFLSGLPDGALKVNPDTGKIEAPSINPYGRDTFQPIERMEQNAGVLVDEFDLSYSDGRVGIYEGSEDVNALHGMDGSLEVFIRATDNQGAPDVYLTISREISTDETVGEIVDFRIGSKDGEGIVYTEEPDLLLEKLSERLRETGYLPDDGEDIYFSSDSVFGNEFESMKTSQPGTDSFIFVDGKYYNEYGSIDYIKGLPDDEQFAVLKANAEMSKNFNLLSQHDPKHVLDTFAGRDTFEPPKNKALLGRVLDDISKNPERKFETIDEYSEAFQQIENKGGSDEVYQLKTDTPEFREWFGDSKVVDENGKPLVVYRGTDRAIGENFSFDPTSGHTPGTWFGADKDAVSAFGEARPYYLSIQNPGNLKDFARARVAVVKSGFDADNPLFNRMVIDELKRMGFDGIIGHNSRGAGGKDVYVAFDPEQIKSVNNRGTFDQNDPRIMYSLKENQKTATLDELIIDIDGQQMSVKELFKSADNDIAMAENIKLCASLGA